MPFRSSSSSRGPVRLSDIAARLKVSAMTVSLALRAHPSISLARIEEVRKTATEMGYRPNAMAAALAHRKWSQNPRSRTAALAWINQWEHPDDLRKQRAFNSYWEGAAAAADALGYHLEEFAPGGDMTRERLQKILLTRNIEGIVVPPHPKPPEWTGIDFTKFSVVRFGHSVSNLPVDLISTDQVRIGLIGFSKIREHGYRRIGLVTSQWAERNTLFPAGFLQAASKIDPSEQLPPLAVRDAGEESFAEDAALLDLWLRKTKAEAILTDVANIRKMLAKIGRRVPEDLGLVVIGHVDNDLAGISQNAEEVGRMAIEMLVTLIQRGIRGIPSAYRVHLASPAWHDGASLPVRAPIERPKFARSREKPGC